MILFILLLFIGGMRIRGWRNWMREDPLVHSYKWLRPDLVTLLLFFNVSRISLLVVLVFYLILLGLMRNSERPGFPVFVALGKGRPALRKSIVRLRVTLLPEVSLPCLTGQMLAVVVQSKGATAGSHDGWGWRELKVLPVSWYDGLARILTTVEDTGVWPDGLLDA